MPKLDRQALWGRLSSVASLRFTASSNAANGWNGVGRGRVVVEAVDATALLFHEQ